jgi:S-adenosylmethionine-diacylglycerol 3-amino-3-carboxypropyl transferase
VLRNPNLAPSTPGDLAGPAATTLLAPQPQPLERTFLTAPTARADRLFFAQVREDPTLEIAALRPHASGRYAMVSSGGCTVLSLLAAGAGEVVAVDLNATQHHLVELKAAACTLGAEDARAFLGAAPMNPWAREARWFRVRSLLSPEARVHWQERRRVLRAGVLGAGVTEKFLALVARAVRHLVHSPARVQRLLAATTLDQQRDYYDRVWNNRRWRWLFRLLTNRFVMKRTYDPAFFAHVPAGENPSFATHFLTVCGHALRELPVSTNYFLHHLLTGRYPEDNEAALPPYLTRAGARAVADNRARLRLFDGDFTSALRAQPAASLDGFALSNILEWLDRPAQLALLTEVVRTARPGARVVLRNFVGWTQLPEAVREQLVIDEGASAAATARDRSLVQRRFVSATVRKAVEAA